MKKVIFSLLAVMALGFFTSNAQAQTSPALKVGVFDYDVIVGHLPEYKDVQKKIEEFEKDSLGPRRDAIEYQYNRTDSTYKADSASKKSKAVLDMINQQRQQYAWQLINWQQIVQNAERQKFAELSQPLYDKVQKVLMDEVKAQKITLVIKPDDVIYVDDKTVINLFNPVAKTLGIDLKAPATDSTGAGQ
jgi:Skp family chaperone for outer membrane proteins